MPFVRLKTASQAAGSGRPAAFRPFGAVARRCRAFPASCRRLRRGRAVPLRSGVSAAVGNADGRRAQRGGGVRAAADAGSRRAVQPSPAFVPRAMRPGADGVVRCRLPAAASGGFSRRSFRCPGAAVRFSPPPHSCPAPCVPVRMRSCGAVCRPRLPADIPAAAHRCRTSSAERTSFGGPNPASAHFRLRACAFVASVRGGTALRSRPDRGTALPVGEPVSAGPSCRGAVYRGRRREAVRRVFRPSP